MKWFHKKSFFHNWWLPLCDIHFLLKNPISTRNTKFIFYAVQWFLCKSKRLKIKQIGKCKLLKIKLTLQIEMFDLQLYVLNTFSVFFYPNTLLMITMIMIIFVINLTLWPYIHYTNSACKQHVSFFQNVQLHPITSWSILKTSMSAWHTRSFSITQFLFRILTVELNIWVFVFESC